LARRSYWVHPGRARRTSVAIIMFYIAYLCVTGPLLIARRGRWPTAEHGPYSSLSRWGLPVNVLAVAFQVFVLINLFWPRAQVYGGDHWYYQWGAFVFVGILGGVGAVSYLFVYRGRSVTVLANPLTRSYLREAFRAVASVQSGLSNELSLGVRWG
jgi:hypothetical protein